MGIIAMQPLDLSLYMGFHIIVLIAPYLQLLHLYRSYDGNKREKRKVLKRFQKTTRVRADVAWQTVPETASRDRKGTVADGCRITNSEDDDDRSG